MLTRPQANFASRHSRKRELNHLRAFISWWNIIVMECRSCTVCQTGIDDEFCPAIECNECKRTLHHSCANFPVFSKTWRCSGCSKKAKENQLSEDGETQSKSPENELVHLSKEISELKHFNAKVMVKIKALNSLKSIHYKKDEEKHEKDD